MSRGIGTYPVDHNSQRVTIVLSEYAVMFFEREQIKGSDRSAFVGCAMTMIQKIGEEYHQISQARKYAMKLLARCDNLQKLQSVITAIELSLNSLHIGEGKNG